MSSSAEVDSLNKIIAIIDDKATLYKEERFDMPAARKNAEQKMIMDMIADALKLAGRMDPSPAELMLDLRRLEKDLLQY